MKGRNEQQRRRKKGKQEKKKKIISHTYRKKKYYEARDCEPLTPILRRKKIMKKYKRKYNSRR